MADLHLHKTRRSAYRLQFWQAGFVFFLALLLGVFHSWVAARSLAIGGAACVLPGFYFVFRTLGVSGASQLRRIAVNFWIAECVKLLFTAAIFYLSIRYLDVQFWALVLGFLVAQLFFACLAPFVLTQSV